LSRRPRLAPTLAAAILAIAAWTLVPAHAAGAARGGDPRLALPPRAMLQADRARFRGEAARGLAAARANWWNPRHRWYDRRLNSTDRYPLATIWGIVHLFEAVDAVAIDRPTARNRAAVDFFARKSEHYWDRELAPAGGYAPYIGDHGGDERAWFDDNGWLGIAFVDAYRATREKRYLADAARALQFIVRRGWDPVGGGLWSDTVFRRKTGESLASASALAAMLYESTGRAAYLKTARRFLAWGDAHFTGRDGLYVRSDVDPTPMGYVEGPMLGAHDILCRRAHDARACTRAEALAQASLRRFGVDANHGPRYDTIYMRWLLELYRHDHDPRWYSLARRNALRALRSARDASGLFLRAWDGGSAHESSPGLLQTHGATVALLAWLAATPLPER
jgi:hypothetical protein